MTWPSSLLRLRLGARLTQEELAARTGLSVRSVRNLELGRVRAPRVDTVRLLGTALGLSGAGLDAFVGEARAGYWTSRGGPPHEPADRNGNTSEQVRCVPRRIPDICGRTAEIEHLLSVTRTATPAVVAVDGMAGVGKTTLAIEVAFRLGDSYPDAHLYLDLHGHSERPPVAPVEAAGLLLRQLNVTPDRIPPGLAERAALWRSELARRRSLVVLDNAHDSDQVRPLLPATDSCVVLITSRRRLMGLDAAHALSLGRLDHGSAVEMMTRVAGERVLADHDAAAELVALCGGLPLALRIAAAKLTHRPGWTVGDLVHRLRRAQHPSAELAVEGRAVSAAFTLSYSQLPTPAQRVFRLLAVHPGGTFETHCVAAIAGLTPADANDIVEQLVDVHLLDTPADGRYRFHDLLLDYAGGLLDKDGDADRADAQVRLLDYYLNTTAAATAGLESAHGRLNIAFEPGCASARTFATSSEAESWLHHHWMTVITLLGEAHDARRHRHVVMLAQALWPYLYQHGPFSVATTVHERSLEAATALADERLQALAADRLASAHSRTGDWPACLDTIERAVRLWRSCQDDSGLQQSLSNSAAVYGQLGRFAECIAAAEEALTIATRRGLVIPAESARVFLGVALRYIGRAGEALAHHRHALAAAFGAGHEALTSRALREVALDHLVLGHHRLAALLLSRVLSLPGTLPYGTAEALSALGTAHSLLGRSPAAMAAHRTAVAGLRELGDPACLAMALNDLGASLLRVREHADALAAYQEALELAERPGVRFETARAHAGIGQALDETSPAEAARHHRIAMALFEDMGTPESETVARHLAALSMR